MRKQRSGSETEGEPQIRDDVGIPAKRATEAAFAQGDAPITLIDGDTLVDPLIEHGISVRKHRIDILTIDLDGLSPLENLVDA